MYAWSPDDSLSLIVGTTFSHGQTVINKTYTIARENVPETRGITQNSFAHMFGYIAKNEEQVQYIEDWNIHLFIHSFYPFSSFICQSI